MYIYRGRGGLNSLRAFKVAIKNRTGCLLRQLYELFIEEGSGDWSRAWPGGSGSLTIGAKESKKPHSTAYILFFLWVGFICLHFSSSSGVLSGRLERDAVPTEAYHAGQQGQGRGWLESVS